MQVIALCQEIFHEEHLDIWLRPYTILCVGDQAGTTPTSHSTDHHITSHHIPQTTASQRTSYSAPGLSLPQNPPNLFTLPPEISAPPRPDRVCVGRQVDRLRQEAHAALRPPARVLRAGLWALVWRGLQAGAAQLHAQPRRILHHDLPPSGEGQTREGETSIYTCNRRRRAVGGIRPSVMTPL